MCTCNSHFIDDALVIEVREGGEYVVKPQSTGIICYVQDLEEYMKLVRVGDVISLEEVSISYNNGQLLYWVSKEAQLNLAE